MSREGVMIIKKVVNLVEKRVEEFADWAAHFSGSPWFLIAHVVWFSAWIGFQIEPFPYGLLTMIVSLEAIILSSLILNATDRESARDRQVMSRDLRVSKDTQKLLEHMHQELLEVKNYIIGEEGDL